MRTLHPFERHVTCKAAICAITIHLNESVTGGGT